MRSHPPPSSSSLLWEGGETLLLRRLSIVTPHVSLPYPVTLRKKFVDRLRSRHFFFFFFFFPFRSSLLSLDKFWVESLYTNYRIIGEEVEMKFLERWFRIEIPRRFHGNWDRWRLLCIRNVVLRHGSRTVSIDTIKFRPERLSYSSIQTQPLVAG